MKELQQIMPLVKQRMNDGLEKKEKQLLQNSGVHANGDVRASVVKFANTSEELLIRYNPNHWIKAYEHPEVTFNIGTSPVIKDADYAFGHEIIIHWVNVSLLELADKEFIKLPAERGSSRGIAESLLPAIRHWQMGEWMYFCEMLTQGKLGEVKRFMATSELHGYIRQFEVFKQSERKKIEDVNRLSYEEKENCILKVIYDKFTDVFNINDRTTAEKNNFVRIEIVGRIIEWCNQQSVVISKDMSDEDIKLIIYWYKYILDSHGIGKNSVNFNYKKVI